MDSFKSHAQLSTQTHVRCLTIRIFQSKWFSFLPKCIFACQSLELQLLSLKVIAIQTPKAWRSLLILRGNPNSEATGTSARNMFFFSRTSFKQSGAFLKPWFCLDWPGIARNWWQFWGYHETWQTPKNLQNSLGLHLATAQHDWP